MNPRDFRLSNHAIARLRERHPTIAKDVDSKFSDKDTALKKKLTYEYFYEAKEERGFLNDTKFMIALYEKYGYDRKYCIFGRDDILFVGVIDEECCIVTTLTRDMHSTKHVRIQNKKWKKKD